MIYSTYISFRINTLVSKFLLHHTVLIFKAFFHLTANCFTFSRAIVSDLKVFQAKVQIFHNNDNET